ncbi:MAG: hypothetical protein M0R06_20250 [Sphaerochaeta sp.]|jgi:hypothetical protein|nr:hypothetical protein [Sphaerochaeta sp.]
MNNPTKTRYKHIQFVREPRFGAPLWVCRSNRGREVLGTVQAGAWSRVTFFPQSNTEFSADCLDDISHFIGQLEESK